jgi:outer membrane protein TolC
MASMGLQQLSAQTEPVLTFEEFRVLMKNHPKVAYAVLAEERGAQELTRAKGAFDPRLSGNYNYKFFKGTEYYNQTAVGLDIPLRAPLVIKSKYENADGAYFNPEETTPNSGLLSVGVAVPFGQGLITDKARTELRQAEAFVVYSKLQRTAITQELLRDAYRQYWLWWMNRRMLDLSNEWVTIAANRLDITKQRFALGDVASIDTLETFIQLQQREQKAYAAGTKLNKEQQELRAYLWSLSASGEYALVENELRPQREISFDGASENIPVLTSKAMDIVNRNPELMSYAPVFDRLRAEERLKKEFMKPIVNLQYNALTEPTAGASDVISSNNYKWGAQLAWPIFMRKAKGELELTRIKIQETSLEAEVKIATTRNKALALIENLNLLRNQLATLQSNVRNMEMLLDAERDKFNSGESSVFLINVREQQLFDLRMQEVDASYQLKATELELLYLLGELN